MSATHAHEPAHLKQTGIPSVFTYDRLRVFFQYQMRNDFSRSLLFANDLLGKMLHKSLPTDGNRRALLGLGRRVRAGAMLPKQQAVARRKERASSFRAAITKPPPLSAVRGRKHSLAPQDTANKKLLSLESQQDNDGKRLGLSNERNSPSEPCWATKPRGQKMEMSDLVGVKAIKKITPKGIRKSDS